MGFVKDVVGGITGSGADAAKKAAGQQVAGQRKASKTLKAATKFGVEALQPFTDVGRTDLEGLGSLVTDPEAQRSFIQDNPFFEALATRSQEGILSGKAASGKAFSGGTAEALQNSLLLLGTDLLNQNISQRSNLANLGFSSSQQQADIKLRGAGAVAGQQANIGESQAAGILGARAAQVEAVNTVGKAIAACDIRVKENIIKVGKLDNGLPLYSFNYIWDSTPQINVMAQDVEKVIPDAVIEINGIKHVDTEMAYGWNK